jgi:uncharacterized membrane protein
VQHEKVIGFLMMMVAAVFLAATAPKAEAQVVFCQGLPVTIFGCP